MLDKFKLKLKSSYWGLSFLIWLSTIASAQAAVELRIAIKQGVSQVRVGSSTKAVVTDAKGNILGEISPMTTTTAGRSGNNINVAGLKAGEVWIQPRDNGYVWIGDRWYRGVTHLIKTGQGLIAINQVDIEKYLYSVLGAEMGKDWPSEALKAQAVAARSYALHSLQTKRNRLFDLGNNQTWQVYKGVESESAATQQAVQSTAGQVLTYNGQIILAVFHSASGGHTENVENVWSSPLPYLRGVPDYDQGTPGFAWSKTFTYAQLSNIFGVGNISSIIPERVSNNGRIMTLKVVGNNGTKRISGERIRGILGLKSTRFAMNSTASGLQFNGYGFGHGLGLSQWGAYNLAREGINYQQILLHYYQGTTLAKLR
jgi:stage II sporulation protein D